MTKEVNNNNKKGFGSFSAEKAAEIRAKSAATRKANREKKLLLHSEAAEKRKLANEYLKKAEILQQDADLIDGQCSSEKNKKKANTELIKSIDDKFRDTVAPSYLKMMKQYAVSSNLSVDQLVTPSFAALDILHNESATTKEKQEAMKMLQQFENARPQAKVDEEGDAIGSVQEELDSLMGLMAQASPKDWAGG